MSPLRHLAWVTHSPRSGFRAVLDIPAVFTRTVMGECAPSQTEYYVTHLSLFIQVEDCLTRHTLGGASDLPPTEGDHVVYGA